MGNLCGNCFRESLNEQGVCTACGFDGGKNKEKYPLALPAGSILNGRYIIGKVLGQGGFGITYMARDHQTGTFVAIKEFFPDSMATRTSCTTVTPLTGEKGENFAYGKDTFLNEARTMAQFIGNPNIVRVDSYFEENGTGYFVMEYVEGKSFQELLRENYGRISWEEALKILLPVMDALSAVHEKGIIHRDVAPDNICIARDGTVKLLDFGAARYSLGNVSQSLDVVLRHGFAPKEQYKRHGRQGPYTDIYALGATFYYAITGTRPDDAIERLDEDTLPLPSTLGANVTEAQEDVILKAMAIQPEDRYRSVAEFKAALTNQAPRLVPKPVPKPEPKPAPVAKPDPKPEPAPVPAPKAKLPKWLIPAGAAVAAVALGVLIGTGIGGDKEEQKLEAPATEAPVVEAVQTEAPTIAETLEPEVEQKSYLMADGLADMPYSKNADEKPFWGQYKYARNEVKRVRFVSTMKDVPSDAWDVSAAEDGSIMAWFDDGDVTVAANGKIQWNTNSSMMFFYFTNLKSVDFGDCIDTSNVTDMSWMFHNCSSLKELDLSAFDTSSVTTMGYMFNNCNSLTELDLSGFDTSMVTTMYQMFDGCNSLTELDLSDWDTSKVESMWDMFNGCNQLASLDLRSFNTSNVTKMQWMFNGCSALTSLDLSGFDTSTVTSMTYMFNECSALTELDISGFDTSNVTDMSAMFSECSALTELDLSGFDTSNVTDMGWMFNKCSALTELDLSIFDTSKVTEMDYMFSNCSALTELDLSNFDTSNVTHMGNMFYKCSALTKLDLSGFDTSKVNYLTCMFDNCDMLEKPKCKDDRILKQYGRKA